MLAELPLAITGKVLEKTQGGFSASGQRPQDCDFLGHLPPGASYHLVEIDLTDSEPPVAADILDSPRFRKQLTDRRNKRISKGAKEEKYFGKVDKIRDRQDKEYKQRLGMFDHVKPDQPVIPYLAQQQAVLEEEEQKAAAEKPTKIEKPKTCAFLDDEDDEPGFEGLLEPKQGVGGGPKKGVGGELKQTADAGLGSGVDWAAGLHGGGFAAKSEVVTKTQSANPFANMQINPPPARARLQSGISSTSA